VELTDLASKHGTEINNKSIPPGEPIMLNHHDRISLAHGAAVLQLVVLHSLDDETMEITTASLAAEPVISLKLDIQKRQCSIGPRVIALSPKEWNLLYLLHSRQGQAVSLAEVKTAVWPERQLLSGQVPSVGIEEINLLIYRVRQKLGNEGTWIKNIRGMGCMLEWHTR
jgi:DNA-binding response OmpR family regulator